MSYGGNNIPDSYLRKFAARSKAARDAADQARFERKINEQFGFEDA